MSLNAITVPALSPTSQGVIVTLHGWGANAQDLASLAPLLNLSDCEFYFLDAPLPHPYIPDGRMWYDLADFNPRQWGPDRRESCDQVRAWLEVLPRRTGIPLERTLLGGFSQGGAMAIEVGWSLPLAGIVSLSGYLQSTELPGSQTPPPVAIAHGTRDTVVPLGAAQQARTYLSAQGADVTYAEFEMGHEICPAEIAWWRSFVRRCLDQSSQRSVAATADGTGRSALAVATV